MNRRSRLEKRKMPLGAGSTRRTFLKQVGAAGLAAAAGAPFLGPRASAAASAVTLSVWTGYPEIEPFYKKAA